jgi:secretion/DNA translocation related CpaE-like protein
VSLPTTTSTVSPAAIATASPMLADAVLRLAAAANVDCEIVDDPQALRAVWATAPLLVVGDDLAVAAAVSAPAGLDRRPGVLLAAATRSTPALEAAITLGAERVCLLPDDETWLLDRLLAAGERGRVGAVIGMVGARGGVGVTTTAAAVAQYAARRSLSVVAVDGDGCCGDLDLRLEVDGDTGLRWADLRNAAGRLPAEALATALPTQGGVAVLGGGEAPPGPSDAADPALESMATVVPALQRAFDLVVVDLPVGRASLLRPTGRTTLLVITSTDGRGVRAARRMAGDPSVSATSWLVVRTARRRDVESEAVADSVGLRLAATVRDDRRVAADHERGEFVLRSSLARSAHGILAALAQQGGGQ